MEGQLKLILAARPEQEPEQALAHWPHWCLAHLAYRAEEGLGLTVYQTPKIGRGGLLYLAAASPLSASAWHRVTGQLGPECARQGYLGVVADLAPEDGKGAQQLARLCLRLGLTLYLPQWAQEAAPQAKLLLPLPLAEGGVRPRLAQLTQRYGGRGVLALKREALLFRLPAPTGAGEPLTPQALAQRVHRPDAKRYWSAPLCAHYCTCPGAEGVELALYDDRKSLEAKLELAAQAGIQEAFLPWDALATE